ncbi:hypothetical protein PCANC_04949 [Puccinia coronata f. sp. avenae]|uniref:Formin GTPase-binding domain-containing protein n=1 Tax=Puccinia coronata f. sp. avenae TaxID=200324 RepID=A0A2N5VWK3_9BASI|nr:hypothetical protein PCANC_04949 [Puccinia coronata f. sp. avenae]
MQSNTVDTQNPHPTSNNKLKLIAAKLITGVHPVPSEVARLRWNSNIQLIKNTEQQQLDPPRPFADHSRSVTASVFAAARQERANQRHNSHQPPNTTKVSQQQHQRSHTQFDIIQPPHHPPFFHQALSPARSAKSSAPAVMDHQDEDEVEDLALLQLIHNSKAYQSNENLPPPDPRAMLFSDRPRHAKNQLSAGIDHSVRVPAPVPDIHYVHRFAPSTSPHPNDRYPTPSSSSSPLTSPSKAPKPHKAFFHAPPSPSRGGPSTKTANPMRELYLSQQGNHDGKIENEKQRVDREFEKLLDTMQITDVVRMKMTGLDHPVKSAMLKSSTSANLMKLMGGTDVSRREELMSGVADESSKQEGSAWWAMYLKSHNFRELQAADLKKLRVALRTKPPEWSREFVGFGGYNALLKRLKELLEIEWREEQHDDQVLYEILRCFKALLLTDPGRKALASRLPDPFIQLTALLYSEKKPGDLTTRQVLVEIIQGCFQLDEFLRARPMNGALLDWTAPIVIELSPGHPAARQLDCNPDEILEPLASAHLLLRKLIVGPPDPKKANIVDFVAVTHRVRPFKTFVNEFIGVLMDYFWVFCHAENQFWDLKTLDEETIEAPKVPSGMTGGVEYEAMSYCTCLMKLLNQIIKTAGSAEGSKQIFQEIFESGFERCLVTLRKSSVDYYPMVHLELARFISLGLANRFEFPYNILKFLNGYSGHPL